MAKKSFFDHPYYRMNKFYLSSIGTWPEQSLFVRCLMPFVIWAILMSFMIPEIIRLPSVWHDVDTLLDCIPSILIVAISFTQLFNGSFNRKKINVMLNRISSDWKRLGKSPNIEIIHKYAARGRFITKTYSTGMYFVCVFYVIMPAVPAILDLIVPLNETRKKNDRFEAEYVINSDDYYWPVLAHSYVTKIVSILVIISSEVMFFAMVEHACALFEIVGINLNMVKTKIVGEDPMKANDYKMICHCIDLHREAIIFADLIEATYSVSFVGVIGFCLIILSISGVQTLMHLDQPEQMLRYGMFSIGQIFHLYFNSVPGQKLIDYSVSIFDYAYADDWDGLSLEAKKLLIMIMMRSLKPCQITAGKVYVMSMENYNSVMQTSMSYFTIVSSMR